MDKILYCFIAVKCHIFFNSDVFVMLVNKFLFDQQLESNIKYQIHVPECFSRSMGDYSKEKRSVSLV